MRPASENLATMPDDVLADIMVHVNREKYPDRYQAVRTELVRRHGSTVQGVPIDEYFDGARRQRPFAERSMVRKKILLALLAWSALMLMIKGVLYLIAEMRAP